MMITNKNRLKTHNKWSSSHGSLTIITSEPMPGIDPVGQRMAKCSSCGLGTWSNPELPFFKDLKAEEAIMDSYYCGCRGWD